MYCEEVLYSWLTEKLGLNYELDKLIDIAKNKKIDIHNFKNSKLPRCEKVLGILKSIRPPSLLDVGFGRGTFLYPLLEFFGNINIASIDKKIPKEPYSLLKSYNNLILLENDFLYNGFPDKSFHTLTALEVMEHVEDTEKFVEQCVRLSYGWIILSVPSKVDNNPQHIHFFTEDKINKLFSKYNLKPKYEYVLNHMIIKVKI